MLRRLALRDFVIVTSLEVDFDIGFSVLTGETGAGKSILVDALQLALGSRGDAGVVREGAARAEISAEVDAPPSARTPQAELERERERLAWQIGEVDKLAPGNDEWDELEAEHKKLANGQALIDAARSALDAIAEADDNAEALIGRALHALE